MGKIMKDGIQYGVGGIQKAESITYDNTASGMTATNVQGAIDELNKGLTTKSLTVSNIRSGASLYANQWGKIVSIMGSAENVPSGQWVDIGTISEGRPSTNIGVTILNSAVNSYALLRITPEGIIRIWQATGSSMSYFGFSAVYLIL